MCFTPVAIKNPDIHAPAGTIAVPCGKCSQCLNKRSTQWAFRLLQEDKVHHQSLFVTLTYAETNDSLSKSDLQKFFKRLRKGSNRKSIRYYACGEYGGLNERPHYHIVLFDAYPQEVEAAWPLGFCHFGKVEIASIKYVTNYMMKGKLDADKLNGREPEFSLMSKKMGLNFLTPEMMAYLRTQKVAHVVDYGGIKVPMPRYYRDRIYTEREIKDINELTEFSMLKRYYDTIMNHYNGDETLYEKERADAFQQHVNNIQSVQKLKRQKI